MERSTELTVDPARRAGRTLVAAEAKRQAGAVDSALRLADMAERGPLDDFQRAQLDLLRAQISFASDRGSDARRGAWAVLDWVFCVAPARPPWNMPSGC
jgi:hypothetical protein